MTPDQLAISGSESAHQKAFFCWAALNGNKYPGLHLMFAIANGSLRNIITGARLKAEGVKAGVPDIFLPVMTARAPGLFLELKRSGGIVAKEQIWWLRELEKQGYRAEVCYGWQEAVKVIEDYLNG
jgi:hypothetical protein